MARRFVMRAGQLALRVPGGAIGALTMGMVATTAPVSLFSTNIWLLAR